MQYLFFFYNFPHSLTRTSVPPKFQPGGTQAPPAPLVTPAMDTPRDERLAKILLTKADSVMSCIKMEVDWPSKNRDKKMSILDLKVWMSEDQYVMFQHYEKGVSIKTILHSQLAHSSVCKRSVHTHEVVRRLMNSLPILEWKTEPVVTEYTEKMRKAGYKEIYSKCVTTCIADI